MSENRTENIVQISSRRLHRRPATVEINRAPCSSGSPPDMPREPVEFRRVDDLVAMNDDNWDEDTAHRLDDAADELRRRDEALRSAYRSGNRASIDAARAALQTAVAQYLYADATLYTAP